MYHFWDSILLPLLRAAHAKSLVEIGVERGLLTEKLLAYAADAGAVVNAVDPKPQIDVASWRERHGETFVFHQALSLDVLGDLRDADAVLIDGDHNWFTVYHELKLVEETRTEDGALMPLIVMHDVDWPYGRRDLYYDPSTIPEEHRQPYRRTGMVPDDPGLVDIGVNAHLYNAVTEGSARNGVRTALEDFIADSTGEWSQTFVPGFHGLGVIVPVERLNANAALGAVIERLHSPDFLESWAREIEMARIQVGIEAEERIVEAEVRIAQERECHAGKLRALDSRLQEFDRLQAQLVHSEARLAGVPDLHLRIADLERQLQDARAATEVANERANELDGRLTQARTEAIAAHRWLHDVQSSPSWRLTAPLRRAKHLLKGE